MLLIKWDTSNDTFEPGQWLRGRIYERRCDLSPKGDLLVYFAGNQRKPYYTWSAISRPPWLKALAFWPKGDAWGGGGQWISSRKLALNHRAGELVLAEDTVLPKWLTVVPFGERPGWGEDDPIWMSRLERDGWKLIGTPAGTKNDFGARVWIEYDPPITWRKLNPCWPKSYALDMAICGIKEQGGPWYLVEHSVLRGEDKIDKLGRTDWADWSHSGDLLFAMDGCVFRVPCKDGNLAPLEDALKLADFTSLQFEPLKAPMEALRWPKR